MTTRARMTYRAKIERDNGALPRTAWNQKAGPSWGTHLASLPCYVWVENRAQGEVIGPGAGVVAMQEVRMVVPRGTDVTERDRVVNVLDRRGQTYLAGTFNIRSVAPRADHLELMLEEAA